jgi:hypothetical protein
MALPVLSKTWQFSLNTVTAAGATALACCQNAVYAIKQALKAFALSPCTVWGSNSGAGAFGNADGVDRWAASTNLIWAAAGANHSWIVLNLPGMGAKTAVCFDCANATPGNMAIVLSGSAGFGAANGGADGTATARPTATDEVIVCAAASSWGGPSAAIAHRVSAMLSTDGQCLRVFMFRNAGVATCLIIDTAKSPLAQWLVPVYGCLIGLAASTPGDPGACSYTSLYNSANSKSYLGASCALQFTGEGDGTSLIGQTMTFADEDSGDWWMGGMGLYFTTPGHRGKKGQVFDLWWASTLQATANAYPNAAPLLQFMEIGDLIVPWDGATALITT